MRMAGDGFDVEEVEELRRKKPGNQMWWVEGRWPTGEKYVTRSRKRRT